MTKLLFTKIPFFKEVIVGSFECGHCGYKNNQLTSGGRIQEKGSRIALQISCKDDMNRQVVKSEHAAVKIPHVDLEIPPNQGVFTTIEGIIDTVCNELGYEQAARRLIDPETASKIDAFIAKLGALKDVKEPFQLLIDDPTGNSNIENKLAPAHDPLLHTMYYSRTREQNEALCLPPEPESTAAVVAHGPVPHTSQTPAAGEPGVPPIEFSDEVLEFSTNCTQCNTPCKTNMKLVDIPRFKQVIIMAMVCDGCGYRDNEVKSGSGIEKKGRRLKLILHEAIDLSRDVLKSETATFEIPELSVYLGSGTLGGRFTTIEGLITTIKDQLANTHFAFTAGDSSGTSDKEKMVSVCDELGRVAQGQRFGVHIIIDDPAGNSYIQDIYEPKSDPYLTVEDYERSKEQNDDLGLTNMNTASTDQVTTTPNNDIASSSDITPSTKSQ